MVQQIEGADRRDTDRDKGHAGNRPMTLREFLDVTKDNVIILDRYVDDLVDIVINDRPIFKGKMGVYKGNKAVRIEKKEEGWKSL
jgi:flagellar motor switch protein FliM